MNPRIEPDATRLRLVDSPPGPLRAGYRRKMEIYAERIRRAGGIPEIVGILDQALRETRALHGEAPAEAARRRAAEAERQIEALRSELELVNGLLREDPLTGALNRRGLAEGYERETARSERQGSVLSLLVIDIDHFKRLNDTYGHAAGDQALIHLVGVISATLRPSDLVARHGGEEFALVLTEAHLDEARQCALRLQAALAAAPLEWNGQRVSLTFSAGAAQRQLGEPLEQCLQRADAALYAAKRAGRNRVKTAP